METCGVLFLSLGSSPTGLERLYGIYESIPLCCVRYLDRIIRGPELQEFATMLMDHQKATTGDGMYVVQGLTLFKQYRGNSLFSDRMVCSWCKD